MAEKIKDWSCTTCFYNFRGTCAWNGNKPNTYGRKADKLIVKYPNGCEDRHSYHFYGDHDYWLEERRKKGLWIIGEPRKKK